MAITGTQTRLAIDDEWRRWIAENLLLGASPQDMYARMLQAGVDANEAVHELQQAQRSPYLAGAQRLHNRLAKHDWVLDNQRRLNRLLAAEIPRRQHLSREEFLHDYYSAGRPVLITGMMDDWPALAKWSLDYFESRFAERTVQVQYGRNSDARYEINKTAHLRTMPFGEYVRQVRAAGRDNDCYMTAYNEGPNRQALAELWDDIVQVPAYLSDKGPTQGFLWLGPAGTITPFHHDLTNNFMAQVLGRKRVRVIPACEIAHMYNTEHCFSAVDGRAIDLARYPLMRDVRVLECILQPGEILFLPVGCWHFVEALDVSATVSFTNFLWDNDFTAEYPRLQAF